MEDDEEREEYEERSAHCGQCETTTTWVATFHNASILGWLNPLGARRAVYYWTCQGCGATDNGHSNYSHDELWDR